MTAFWELRKLGKSLDSYTSSRFGSCLTPHKAATAVSCTVGKA